MDLFFGGTGNHGKTKVLDRSAIYFRVVGMIYGGFYFRGVTAIGKTGVLGEIQSCWNFYTEGL